MEDDFQKLISERENHKSQIFRFLLRIPRERSWILNQMITQIKKILLSLKWIRKAIKTSYLADHWIAIIIKKI